MNNKLIGWLIMTRFSADSHCILLARTWCGHRDQVRSLFDQLNPLIWIWSWSFLTNQTNSFDLGLFWPFQPSYLNLALVFLDQWNQLTRYWSFLTTFLSNQTNSFDLGIFWPIKLTHLTLVFSDHVYNIHCIWSEIGKLQNCVFAILISIHQRGGRHPQRR